jgi:hypothetical protein
MISFTSRTVPQADLPLAVPPGVARTMRVEHEYDRGGALAYLAAYDVHRARVIGLCCETRYGADHQGRQGFATR